MLESVKIKLKTLLPLCYFKMKFTSANFCFLYLCMILISRTLKIFKELSDFIFYWKEKVKVLALRPVWKASRGFPTGLNGLEIKLKSAAPKADTPTTRPFELLKT